MYICLQHNMVWYVCYWYGSNNAQYQLQHHQWAGHVQRMNEERMRDRIEKRGQSKEKTKLRLRDSVKKDLEKAGVNSREWEKIERVPTKNEQPPL